MGLVQFVGLVWFGLVWFGFVGLVWFSLVLLCLVSFRYNGCMVETGSKKDKYPEVVCGVLVKQLKQET